MKKETLIKKLMKLGYTKERAQEIIKETAGSSNPDFILHYWGVK